MLAKRRKARIIPFGYRADPDIKDYLMPIKLELEALERAKKYIEEDKIPWRSLREWIVKTTGRNISVTGLRKVLGYEKNGVRRSTKAAA